MSKGYISYCRNDNERIKSTSGGVFYTLAKEIICRGGIVYGAVFDENFNVHHVRGDCINDIQRMQGSKYVQSSKSKIFASVKQDLNKGLEVLFCGTPCEVEGLKYFLQKEYDNLISMDFVCLGIPSPRVWEEYITSFHKRKDIENIVFKDKKYGWSDWTFTIYKKKGVFREPGNLNLYMQGYLQHLYIRPSCFDCKFRNATHNSDITIADCWGVEGLAPEMNDQKGVSMVLINSEKGSHYFKNCAGQLITKEVDTEALIKGNPHATLGIKYNSNKDDFFEYKKKYGIKKALIRFAQNRATWKFYLKTLYWRGKSFLFK